MLTWIAADAVTWIGDHVWKLVLVLVLGITVAAVAMPDNRHEASGRCELGTFAGETFIVAEMGSAVQCFRLKQITTFFVPKDHTQRISIMCGGKEMANLISFKVFDQAMADWRDESKPIRKIQDIVEEFSNRER